MQKLADQNAGDRAWLSPGLSRPLGVLNEGTSHKQFLRHTISMEGVISVNDLEGLGSLGASGRCSHAWTLTKDALDFLSESEEALRIHPCISSGVVFVLKHPHRHVTCMCVFLYVYVRVCVCVSMFHMPPICPTAKQNCTRFIFRRAFSSCQTTSLTAKTRRHAAVSSFLMIAP